MRGGLLGGVVSFLGFTLRWLSMFDSFYRARSLVFGGDMLYCRYWNRSLYQLEWSVKKHFSRLWCIQAVLGPLFTFAAYLGAVMGGWQGGTLAAIAIFLPAFLLILGALPYWDTLRRNPKLKGALAGVNAAVVGVLISAFYFPIWTSAILNQIDFAFAAVLFSMLAYWSRSLGSCSHRCDWRLSSEHSLTLISLKRDEDVHHAFYCEKDEHK